LVTSDTRFGDIGIYLGGFYTAPDSGEYNIRNCADEVYAALNRESENRRLPVMQRSKLTFVCHSLGGIVARYLLLENQRAFADKRVGLVLIASPSYGSKYANSLDLVLNVYRHQQGIQLKLAGASLQDLDDRFRDLREKKHIPHLSGVEYYEHHSIFRRGFLAWKWNPLSVGGPVVTKESAGRYFGAPKAIANVDHNSICKPVNTRAQVHQYLYDFMRDHELLPSGTALANQPDATGNYRSSDRPDENSSSDTDFLRREWHPREDLEKRRYLDSGDSTGIPTPQVPSSDSSLSGQDSAIQPEGALSDRSRSSTYSNTDLGTVTQGVLPPAPFSAIVSIVLIVGLVFLAGASRVANPIFPVLAVATVAALALLTIVTVNSRQMKVHASVEERRQALSGVIGGEVQAVLAALENPVHGWRTLEGILRETGLTEDRARAALEYLSDLIITADDTSKGTVYTTVRRYAESEPVFNQALAILSKRLTQERGVLR